MGYTDHKCFPHLSRQRAARLVYNGARHLEDSTPVLMQIYVHILENIKHLFIQNSYVMKSCPPQNLQTVVLGHILSQIRFEWQRVQLWHLLCQRWSPPGGCPPHHREVLGPAPCRLPPTHPRLQKIHKTISELSI